MVSLLIVLAILLAIVLGYHTKINTGFFAIVFAYLIGCFAMGLKPKDVISGWPISTMFIILAVSLFYNFALVNGCEDGQIDGGRSSQLWSTLWSQLYDQWKWYYF